MRLAMRRAYTRHMRASIWIALLAIASCSGRSDGGGDRDSGPTRIDSGPAGDVDAGPPADVDSGPSGDVDSGPPADVDAGPAGDDAGPPPDLDAGPFVGCGFVDTLDDSCTSDADCAYGIHQTDCCGNTFAVGFRTSERTRFETFEPMCQATYPLCGCPSGPTRTDSGESVLGDPDSIRVACVSSGPRRVCLTYVTMRPEDTP